MTPAILDDSAKRRLRILYQEMGPTKLRADLQRSGWHQVLSEPATREYAQQWLADAEQRGSSSRQLTKWLVILAFSAVGAAAGAAIGIFF